MSDFLEIANVIVKPAPRVAQQGIAPATVTPDKLNLPWQPFPNPAITSLFGVNRTFAGFETATSVNAAILNSGFFAGDGAVEARYIKQGQIVRVYVRFTIGSSTRINNLAEDASGATQGIVGVMGVLLPFPAPPAQPYGVGTVAYTETLQAADSSLSHNAPSQALYTQALAVNSNVAYLLNNPVWLYRCKAPAVYNATAAAHIYWSAGDYFELVFEYETNYDG